MIAQSRLRPLRITLAGGLAVTVAAACLPAWSQSQANPSWQEPAGWYGTLALGQALSVGDTTANVNLGGAPVNVSLDGTLRYDGGSIGSLAIGRMGRKEPERAGEQPLHWRVEGEWWSARIDRERFDIGIVSAPLDDRLRAQGLFLNGLVQVAATENTRWWLGGGIGRVKVRYPNASSAVPGCNCLDSASSQATALRIKAVAERKVSESSALFLELGYVDLSGSAITGGTGFPQTRYAHPSFGNVSIGWRTRF